MATALASVAAQAASMALIYSLLGSLAESLATLGMSIGTNLICITYDDFLAGDGNIYNSVIKFLIPSTVSIDIGSIIMTVALGIITLGLAWSGLKIITSTVTGEQAESPQSVLFHSALAIGLIFLFFGGFKFSTTNGTIINGESFNLITIICVACRQVIQVIFSSLTFVSEGSKLWPFINGLEINLNLGGTTMPYYVFGCVVTASIFMASLNCAITYIERLLSFAVYVLFGPIALSLYAFRDTRNSAKSWIQGFFAQLAAIVLSSLMWVIFLAYMIKDNQISMDLTNTEVVFNIICGVVILTMCSRSEQFLNAIGLHTMPSMDAAMSALGGAAALGKAAGMVKSGLDMAGNSIKNGIQAGMDMGATGKAAKAAGVNLSGKQVAGIGAKAIGKNAFGLKTGNSLVDFGAKSAVPTSSKTNSSKLNPNNVDLSKTNGKQIESAKNAFAGIGKNGESVTPKSLSQISEGFQKDGFTKSMSDRLAQEGAARAVYEGNNGNKQIKENFIGDNSKLGPDSDQRKMFSNYTKGDFSGAYNTGGSFDDKALSQLVGDGFVSKAQAINGDGSISDMSFMNTDTGEFGRKVFEDNRAATDNIANGLNSDTSHGLRFTADAVNNMDTGEFINAFNSQMVTEDSTGNIAVHTFDTSQSFGDNDDLSKFVTSHNSQAQALNSNGSLHGEQAKTFMDTHNITSGDSNDVQLVSFGKTEDDQKYQGLSVSTSNQYGLGTSEIIYSNYDSDNSVVKYSDGKVSNKGNKIAGESMIGKNDLK